MESGFELFVSWRYLRSKRKEVFVSLISIISIGGVAVGVTALIVVLALMTGLVDELRDKFLDTTSHILLFKRGDEFQNYSEVSQKIAQYHQVVGVSPFLLHYVMIQSETASADATLKGIDLQAVQTTTALGTTIVDGALDFLEEETDTPEYPGNGLLLGKGLAEKLQVGVNDAVMLVSSVNDPDSQWPIAVRQRFQVTGIFDYGMYEYDTSIVYISISAAQVYLRTGKTATGLEIKVDNIFASKDVAKEIEFDLGKIVYRAIDWSDLNKNLFSIFKLYKILLSLLLAIIVVVACLNVASTLIMMVIEKNHDIAILKSMGASMSSIQKLFVFQGLFIGVVGTGIGCLLGVVACWVADTYHLIRLDGAVYYLNYLPFKIMPLDLILVVVVSILICFLSTLYPAKRAAKLDPAVALRCE